MKAILQKKASENHKRQNDIDSYHTAEHSPTPSPFFSYNNTSIQHKYTCPCGAAAARDAKIIFLFKTILPCRDTL